MLEDPEHFPSLAGIKRKRDGGADTVHVSGRLRPASRLVPVVAAGIAAARAAARRSTSWSRTASRSPRTAARCRSRSATPSRRRTSSSSPAPTSCACGSASADYADDQRIGPEILKTTTDTYRKLRNTIRWMLGNARAFPRGRARQARGDAGARAADAASARRARRAGAQGLRRVRLQAHLRGARPPS